MSLQVACRIEAIASLPYTCAMERQTAIESLKGRETELRARGVRGLYLFGSTLDGKAGPNSDLDLFFDHERGTGFSLFDVMGIGYYLEEELHTKVDIMTRSSLHPRLKADIEAEAIKVF